MIEVLIAVVVVALGLLTLAQFQSSITADSRESKALSEATSYCNDVINEYRQPISISEFDSLASYSTSYSGVVESYNRTVSVSDVSTREKRLVATCSWPGGEITLSTLVSPHSTVNAALTSGAGEESGGGMSPSLNANSTDDIKETIQITAAVRAENNLASAPPEGSIRGTIITHDGDIYIVDESEQTATLTYACAGMDPTPIVFENDLKARRVDSDTNSNYESIELFVPTTIAGTEYCTPTVRFNAGVIVSLSGTLYSRAEDAPYIPANIFTFDVSESGTYCLFYPEPSDTASQADYTCYVGGNCTSYDYTGDDANFKKCPNTQPTISSDVGQGGWRGKVGFSNVADNQITAEGYNVCFSEELDGTATTRDTARNYFTRNTNGTDDTTSDDRNEGLNESYSCQNFLIIEKKTSDKSLLKECVDQAKTITGLVLPSREIMRSVSTATSNYHVESINLKSCEAIPSYEISGTLVNFTSETVYISVGTGEIECNTTSETYTCSLVTSQSSAIIYSANSDYPDANGACAVDLTATSPTGCTLTYPVSTESYTINGYILGSETDTILSNNSGPVTLSVNNGSNSTLCSASDTYDSDSGQRAYSCTFTSDNPNVDVEYSVGYAGYTITAIGATNLAIATADTDGNMEGPDIAVTGPTYITISGQFTDDLEPETVAGTKNLSISVSSSNPNVRCLPLEALDVGEEYECQVIAGDVAITYSNPGDACYLQNANKGKAATLVLENLTGVSNQDPGGNDGEPVVFESSVLSSDGTINIEIDKDQSDGCTL